MRKSIYISLVLIVLSKLLSSCVVTQPTFRKRSTSNPSIAVFENPAIQKKVRLLFKIVTYGTITPIGAIIGGIAGQGASGYFLMGGATGIMVSNSGIKKFERANEVTDANIESYWWKLMKRKDPTLQNYSLFIHNNGKFIKDNVVIAINKDSYHKIASKLIEEENALERQKYEGGMNFYSAILISVAAYVGYQTVKEAFKSDYTVSPNSKNCDDSWEIDPECEGLECYYYTCHSSGQFLRVEQVAIDSYKVGAGTSVTYASNISEARKMAERLTSCNCK